jgi:predicted NBD/HSP70 family sugar kinase
MNRWLFIELGGASSQTAQCDQEGRWWFTPGVVQAPGRPIALACPGVIRKGRVLYATNLGWSDVADPAAELGVDRVPVLMNDAVAAALGEAVLRTQATVMPDLFYIGLGTGVGSAYVANGIAQDLDLGHMRVGGTTYCEGCRAVGCLNSHLAARYLPTPLIEADQRRVASTLARALHDRAVDTQPLVVLGGGIARRYPAIATILADYIPNFVANTAAPKEAKSAAYAGLAHVAAQGKHS